MSEEGLAAGSIAECPSGSTAECPAGSTMEYPVSSTMECPSGSTAKFPAGSTAECPAGSTAECPAGSTMEYPVSSTMECPSGSTAKCPAGSRAECPAGSTMEYPVSSTMECPTGSTAESPSGSTAECPAGSTARCPAGSTGECPAGSTGECLAGSTAECPSSSMAECLPGLTMEYPVDSTAECPARDDQEKLRTSVEQKKFKVRGANRRRDYNKNQHDKIGSSSSHRRHACARYEDKTHRRNNPGKKGKDCINNVVDEDIAQVSEAGAYYHGDTASITKPERKRTEAKQIDGNDHQTDAKYMYMYTAEVNETRQKTRASKRITSRRGNPQGTRLHEQSESARGGIHDSKRDYMSPYYDHQEAPCNLSMQRTNLSRQPCYGESSKPHNKESRQRGSQRAITTAKASKGDYKNQKEDVFRTHGHRNPVQSSQASVLIEQLRNETYECMVCCDRIRCSAAVWSCHNCHHLFHLGCVRKWAKSSANANAMEGKTCGWRCPGCQNATQEIPSVYKCFCGKVIDPEWKRHEGLIPHSCGELCGKRRDLLCQHRCNQLCHPGPCPNCPVMITKACSCGKTKKRVRCGQTTTVLCEQVCNKILNCLTHRCTRICHTDPCGNCQVIVQQTCFCGKEFREALCGTGNVNMDGKAGYWSCQGKCLRALDCGNHYCQDVCHAGVCAECLLKPSLVSCCPCGKALLFDLLGEHEARKSCLDPVPTCKLTCGKALPCSPSKGNGNVTDAEHCCKKECHLGQCGPCDGITKIKCRCGSSTKEIPCVDRNMEEYKCDQRCNKKKQCGRHRCNQKCCVDMEHRCDLVCGKKLRCGYHKCLELCHPGYCPPCLMSGFEELTCHCGSAVLYPPIPCGTLPPECNNPCSRRHTCPHPAVRCKTCCNAMLIQGNPDPLSLMLRGAVVPLVCGFIRRDNLLARHKLFTNLYKLKSAINKSRDMEHSRTSQNIRKL
ncbi:protein shuttle craft-like isoform X3 [Orbicella faveolata]|uniref:protein shuttle craft-like isoform X3 n=1 Tax=Orbicella faveolata TaxID=48498 RepID=UPI0009E39764|nr:protein shuttle craft-like isoform X3 [Orbicella faveolata]